MRLSDSIESFIKAMLSAEQQEIELKRNELAEYFACAPSQINYVLSTRFTPEAGYLIESRRGGGGYIRIMRVVHTGADHLMYLIREHIGDAIGEDEANRLLLQLTEQGLITHDAAQIMSAALSSQAMSVPIPQNIKDALRARSLRTMLAAAARQVRENDSERMDE